MAKKKRRKIKKRKKKTNYTFYLGMFVVIVVLIFFTYYFGLNGFQTYPEVTQPITPEIGLTGGHCEHNQQCFIIGCKSTAIFQCLNTSQMNDFLIHYSENCESYVDVQIKQQDLSFCACINKICTKLK